MRLSANNLNKIEKVNFEGVKQEYSKENEPVYRFTAPICDPDKEIAVLELVYLDVDEKTKHFTPIDSKSERQKPIYFDKDVVEIKQSEITKEHNAFAYRYVIVDKNTKKVKKVLDDYQTVKFSDADKVNVLSDGNDLQNKALTNMNVISHGKSTTISPKAGTMLDMLKDSGAVMNKDKNGLEADKLFFRNHFLKLGGSIEGLNWLLKNTNVLYPYRYIKTTPDMSMDKTSSHGYWPNNIYQSPDKEVLDDFIFELYKRGKGYVADGAYTSQSIQSPLFQHVLKYGKESPFYNMMKINGEIKLGMLPLKEVDSMQDNLSHIGVRIVNPKGDNYNKNKPTYIQFYDDRLSSVKQRQDSSKLIDSYDTWPNDPYEITKSTDSVQPIYFEISPNNPDYENKIEVFKKLGNDVLLKDIKKDTVGVSLKEFLTFPHFEITTYDKASGVVNWDGNTELVKMNLTNPANNSAASNGMKDARKYVISAVDFWSENTQADLILKTAKIKNKDTIKNIALANEITKEEFDYMTKNLNKMHSLVLAPYENEKGKVISNVGKPVVEFVKNYPLQSIETSPELSAIFSEPEFNKEFFNDANVKKIADTVNGIINEAIPEKYKDNEEYKAYAVKTYSSKIIKALLVYAMNSNAFKQDGSIDISKLNNVTLKSIVKQETATVKEERKLVVNHITNGVNKAINDVNNGQNNALTFLQASIKSELDDISLDDFKLAEAIVIKGKAGINWRFDAAKDIADLDSVRDNVTTYDKVWYGDGKNPGAQEFWNDVTGKIRKYNPSSYVINEITSLWEFYNQAHGDNFSTKLSKVYNNGLPDYAERQFIQESNSTTSSNYAYYFNKLSNYIGCDPEFGNPDNFNNKGNLGLLKWQMKCFNEMNQPNAAMYSHIFWENYDKPRILHILALGEDQKIFFMDGGTGFDGKKRFTLAQAANDPDEGEKYAKKIALVAGDNKNYERMSPKAIAVGIMLLDAVKNSKVIPQDIKKDVIKEIKLHALGKKGEQSSLNPKRAERFGVLPYELSMADIFKKVGIEEDLVQKLTDEFCYEMLEDNLKLEERLWQTTCAMGGMSTVYSGMEYGQTGFESSSHNVFQANRGATLHHRYDNKNFKKYYDKMNAISSLYLERGLSSIKEGFTVYMGSQTEDEHEYLPIFKYDDKGSKTICVLTNNGIKDKFQNEDVKSINIKAGDNHEGDSPLANGTQLKRKVYDEATGKYVDEKDEYTVKDGQIVRKDGKAIKIKDTLTVFYVPTAESKADPRNTFDYRAYVYKNASPTRKI